MNLGPHGISFQEYLGTLIDYLQPHCKDLVTLNRVRKLVDTPTCWNESHGLFREIRGKTNAAQSENDSVLVAQYRFEEMCAKTLYNLSKESAPFDPDSPFWVLPYALNLAENLGLKIEVSSIGLGDI